MKISTKKTNTMALIGKEPKRTKICINDEITEQVKAFNYLGYFMSYEEVDTKNKLCKFQRATGLVNRTLKPKFASKEAKTRVYNVRCLSCCKAVTEENSLLTPR